ncbi:MAG TPA: AAA family ATPase, partial [Candidatus Binatia bacterium]|nr:AAA family ATPase [Candidatus Binatia bacterium]
MDQLVGRQRELGVLDAEVARALDGTCRVVLLSGEPGIGKTRLSEEGAWRAEAHGAVVLRGGASQAEGMPPYLPFLEAIAGYVRSTPPDRVRAEAGPVASTVGAIVPELTLLFDELAPGHPLPGEQARLRLYAAVGELLARIATRSGLVLLLDDLQWADPGSLDLLSYAASHQTAARVLILGAHRRAAADGPGHLERMGVELRRRRLLTSLEVGPLAAPAIAELAAGRLGGDVSPDLARRLHEQSEGNPFFAEEFLRTWAEGGALQRSAGAIMLDDTRAETLPLGISDCIRQRLSALPPPARDHLRTAAVAGRAFETGLLAAVTESDPVDLEDELVAAASAGLVRADGPESFSFSHDKIRESLCAEVSPIRARRLHELIGHALESRDGLDGRDPSRRLAALAFHFGRSADRRRGARYEREAAWHALRAYAPAEAVAHFETALGLLDGEDPDRGRLLLGLGEAAGLLGQDALAVRTFEEARTWHEAAGDPVGAAGAAHALGVLRGELRALSSAQAEVDAALHLLEAQLPADRAGLARGYAWRAMEHALQGEWPDVDLLLRGAGPLLEALGTPEHASLLRQLRGFVAYQRGEYPEAVRELQTAVAVGTSGSPSEAVTWRPALLGLGGLLGLAQLAAGEEEESRASLRQLEGVLASAPEGWPAGAARTTLALGWVALGHPE